MIIDINSNKLCSESQRIDLTQNKVLTLVGENGCGKSSILEEIFKQSIQINDKTVVCFSSGQNETYSNIYLPYISNARNIVRKKDDADILGLDDIKTFFFSYEWSKLLVFFASILKKDGLTHNFLKEKYIDTNEHNEDVSSLFSFSVEVGQVYINAISEALKKEETDFEVPTLRKTKFHQILEKLVNNKISAGYEFDKFLRKSKVELNGNDVIQIFGRNKTEIFSFFSIASANDYFIDIKETELIFKNRLSIKELSDGEFQLLAIYSIIDLFDSASTLFLLDEIDSHLYYKNIVNVWRTLNQIDGRLITTSHISDSLVQNNYSSLKIVERGKIVSDCIANELVDRLKNLSNSNEYYYKIASKISYIALVEDESDWIIFKELAKIKLGQNYDELKIIKIQIIKCSSGYSSQSERLGKSKVNWVENFIKVNSSFETQSIFLVCDRDDFTINDFHQNGVEIIGTHRFRKDFGERNRSKAYLLAWKRKQIENYLLSFTMLSNQGKLADINIELAAPYQLVANNPMDIRQIRDLEIKSKIQTVYVNNGQIITANNPEGVDFNQLKMAISQVPASEISEDIEKMYNFIVSKIK
jgi:ABC-type cobalamin/Fe3+-siderophores transport system ATPase subunit